VNFCTVISMRRLPQARVLAASLAEHHAGPSVSVLVLDDRRDELEPSGEPFSVLRPADLELSPGLFEELAILCDEESLVEAMTPRLLLHLVERGEAPVTFLSPTQRAFAPLATVQEALRGSDVCLLPRVASPLPADGRTPSDADALERGALSTSFVAVADGAKEMLSWWAERTAEEAHGTAHPDRWLGGMGQRAVEQALGGVPRIGWLDLAPAYFGAAQVGDRGIGVSFWNLAGRSISADEAGWHVDGQPLRTFDFEGFDVATPHLLSLDQGTRPRVLLSEDPALRELCRDYADRLAANGIASWGAKPYGFRTLIGDVPVDGRMRRLYREALRFDVLSRELPPNPFGAGGEEAFLEWLREPIYEGVGRYVHGIYAERPDLHVAFPNPGEGLAEWARDYGAEEESIPEAVLAPPREEPRGPDGAWLVDLRPGVNVIGFLTANVGLGITGRALVEALEDAGVDHTEVALAHPFANERGSGPDAEAPYDVNVVCGTPDLMVAVTRDLGTEILRDRYSVGLFFWEAERFQPHVARAMRMTNEVWASSGFIADAVERVFDGPVHRFPHPVPAPRVAAASRADLGIPEGFAFLFVFDYSSSFRRKNPLGLVKAFTRTFRPGEGPVLIIKSIFGEKRLAEREQLWFACAEREDIVLLEGTWPPERKDALMATADCYVSLHRSEGLGLTMAEAMALGKPVIATAYSGNLDFMTEENSYLVRHGMTTVGPGAEPYQPDWEWADPDLDHAAELMRRVYENQAEAAERGARAREHILRERSVARAAAFVQERLEAIRSAPRPVAAAAAQTAEGSPEASMEHGETSAQRRARELLERGPDLSAPSRYGVVGRVIRRIVLFLLRPYARHQREVQSAILDAVRASNEEPPPQRD
jgi:glycosyltransferase involved in cell wall biosynthesis